MIMFSRNDESDQQVWNEKDENDLSGRPFEAFGGIEQIIEFLFNFLPVFVEPRLAEKGIDR